jgi:hypothetical protein
LPWRTHIPRQLTEVDASSVGENVQRDITGTADWSPSETNSHYVMLSRGQRVKESLEGVALSMPDHGVLEQYGWR